MTVTFVSRFGKLWMFVSCLLSVQCHFFSDSLCQASFFSDEWHCDCMCSTCDTFVTLWHCVSLVTLWHICDIVTVCVKLLSSQTNDIVTHVPLVSHSWHICDIVTLWQFVSHLIPLWWIVTLWLSWLFYASTTGAAPPAAVRPDGALNAEIGDKWWLSFWQEQMVREGPFLTYLSAKKMGTKICQTWIHGNSLLQNICTVAHLHMCN